MHYTACAFAFMLDSAVAGILLLIMGLIVVLPLSSDPLRAIPRTRMSIWPLENSERRWLRFISPWLNPMTWIVAALLFWKRVSMGIVALAAGVVAAGFRTSARSGGGGTVWRWMPRFPRPLNQLIRKNLREMLSTLDFFCGALISVAGLGWRAAGLLPPEAFFPLTIVAMLSISTCALTLFGLDGAPGMKRYRLMPARGWQILIAKDVAYMAMALLLALPLSIPGAMGAAFVALAFGHRTSVRTPRAQLRWRFQNRAIVRRRRDTDPADGHGWCGRGLLESSDPDRLCRRVGRLAFMVWPRDRRHLALEQTQTGGQRPSGTWFSGTKSFIARVPTCGRFPSRLRA